MSHYGGDWSHRPGESYSIVSLGSSPLWNDAVLCNLTQLYEVQTRGPMCIINVEINLKIEPKAKIGRNLLNPVIKQLVSLELSTFMQCNSVLDLKLEEPQAKEAVTIKIVHAFILAVDTAKRGLLQW